MANPKAPLSYADLRDARDEMIGRVAHQQKRFGMVPDVRAAETFVNPIVEKIARDHERERDRERLVMAPRPERRDRAGVTITGGPTLGAFDFATGQATPGLLNARTQRERHESAFTRLMRACVRRIRNDPPWRARMEAVFQRKADAAETEIRVREVVADWLKVHGNPLRRKPREKKVIVGG